jgi:hypothetical protein
MRVLAYLGSLHNISRSWVDTLIFLRPFIWSSVSGLMRFRYGSDKGTASVHQMLCKSQKNEMETLAMIKQAFREGRMSHTRVLEWHARIRTDQKR